MSIQSWQEVLIAAQSDGTALANTTTATSILPTHAKFVLPSNFFTVGKVLRVTAFGRLSNIVTTPGTITFDLRFNSTPIIVFDGGAVQMSTTAHTNATFLLEMHLTCRAIGSGTSANLMGSGRLTSAAVARTAVAEATDTNATLLLPQSAPAVGTGFDSTVANVVDLFGKFSIANSGNSVQIHQYTLEAVN